jgi:hypothetical protein
MPKKQFWFLEFGFCFFYLHFVICCLHFARAYLKSTRTAYFTQSRKVFKPQTGALRLSFLAPLPQDSVSVKPTLFR